MKPVKTFVLCAALTGTVMPLATFAQAPVTLFADGRKVGITMIEHFSADMNEDGALDFVTVRANTVTLGANATVSIYLSQPVFPYFTDALTNKENRVPFSSFSNLRLADIDGDGDRDLSYGAVWFENRTKWSEPVLQPIGPGLRLNLPTDVDEDGQIDFLVSSAGSTGWFENTDGTGKALKYHSLLPYTGVGGLSTRRDENDQLQLFGYFEDYWYRIEANSGVGRVLLDSPFPTPSTSQSFPIDQDADGVIEELKYIGEVPGGTHTVPLTEINIPSTQRYFEGILDFDNDGLEDYLVSEFNEQLIILRRIPGDEPRYQEQVITTYSYNPNYVVIADLDQDGRLDFISISGQDAKPAWYWNTGSVPNLFTQEIRLSGMAFYAGLGSVNLSDVDQDGDMDIVVNSYHHQNNHSTVWENTLKSPSTAQNIANTLVRFRVASAQDDLNEDLLIDSADVTTATVAEPLKLTPPPDAP